MPKKYIKRCSTLFIISKWQIKTIMRYHLTSIRMATVKKKKKQKSTNVHENVDKLEPLCTVGGHIKWCRHYLKQYGGSSRN